MKNPQSFPQICPETFPVKACRGSAVVTLYRVTESKDGNTYPAFKIPYTEGGVRKFHRFTTYEDARGRANEMLGELTSGNADAITLTNQARASYQAAMNVLPSGVSLEMAVFQFAEAYKILGGGSLTEAARFYAKRHANAIPDKTVTEAVDEFIAAKIAARKSQRYLEDLNYRLGQFKDAFNCNVADVGEALLRQFLDKLKLAPRSQNNFHATLVTFFRWAKKKKYLPKDWDEFASIEKVEDGEGAIEIFTPEELAALLTHADDSLIPFLVIGAFAGLRTSEFCRLDWKDIGVGEGKYIEVKAENARKTKQRRLVPISDNLKVWLEPYAKSSGKIWLKSEDRLHAGLKEVAVNAGVAWKANALRHSFISYRVAESQDVAKVSLEAGNSPQKIFTNYRELVTPKEATRWFSIKPDESAEGKITWLKLAA